MKVFFQAPPECELGEPMRLARSRWHDRRSRPPDEREDRIHPWVILRLGLVEHLVPTWTPDVMYRSSLPKIRLLHFSNDAPSNDKMQPETPFARQLAQFAWQIGRSLPPSQRTDATRHCSLHSLSAQAPVYSPGQPHKPPPVQSIRSRFRWPTRTRKSRLEQ